MSEEPCKKDGPSKDWKDIAKEVTEAADGKKVVQLSEELVRALDEQFKKRGGNQTA